MTETIPEPAPAASKKRGVPMWIQIIGLILTVVVCFFIVARLKASAYDTLYIDLEGAVGSSREEVRSQFGEPEMVITWQEFIGRPEGSALMPGFADPEMRKFHTIEVYGSEEEPRLGRKRAVYLYFDETGSAVFCDKGRTSGWLEVGSRILYQEAAN